MDLSTLANVATALTVLTGVVFGLIEMRRARREREERGAFAAVQALMSPEWMSSAVLVAAIPDGSRAAEIEGDQKLLEAGLKMATIMEGIGYSVFAHIVPLSVADDLVVGTARVAWRKLRPFIEFERERSGSQKSWEWFQWLVEQLERHGQSKTSLKVGAPIAYRDWKPSQYQNGSRDDRECSYDAHSYCGRWIWPGRGPTVQTRAGGARDLRRDSSDSHPRVDEVDAGRTQYSGGSSVSDIEADPRVVDASQAVGVILEGLGYSVYARLVPLQVVGDLVAGRCVWPGENYAPTSKKNGAAAAHRKPLNGSVGSRPNWNGIPQGKTSLKVGAQEAYRDWKP